MDVDDRVGFGLVGLELLLVESGRSNRMVIGELLESQGVRLTSAESCEEALSWLERNPSDLVLLNASLSDAEGREAIRRIRAMGVSVPLLVLAEGSGKDLVSDLESAGMDELVVLPIAPEQLFARLSEWAWKRSSWRPLLDGARKDVPEGLCERLQRLRRSLEANEGDALERFEEVRSALLAYSGRTVMGRLERRVHQFAFEEALVILDGIERAMVGHGDSKPDVSEEDLHG